MGIPPTDSFHFSSSSHGFPPTVFGYDQADDLTRERVLTTAIEVDEPQLILLNC